MRSKQDQPENTKAVFLGLEDISTLKVLLDEMPRPWTGNETATSYAARIPSHEKLLLKGTLEKIISQCEKQEFSEY